MTATIAPAEDPDTQRTQRLLKTGKRVGIVGLVILVIGGAILGTGLFKVFKELSQMRDGLEVEVPVPGSSEIYLEPDTYDVVAIGNGLTESVSTDGRSNGPRTRTSVVKPTVTITDGSGTPAARTGSNSSFSYANSDYELVSMGSFRVDTADTYRIEVTGEPGQGESFGQSGRVTSIGVGPSDGSNSSWLALGGGALFGLALLVTIVGIGLLVAGRVRRSRSERALSSMPSWAPVPGPPNPTG